MPSRTARTDGPASRRARRSRCARGSLSVAPLMYPKFSGVPSTIASLARTSSASASKARFTITSTPSMSSLVAPSTTASVNVCVPPEPSGTRRAAAPRGDARRAHVGSPGERLGNARRRRFGGWCSGRRHPDREELRRGARARRRSARRGDRPALGPVARGRRRVPADGHRARRRLRRDRRDARVDGHGRGRAPERRHAARHGEQHELPAAGQRGHDPRDRDRVPPRPHELDLGRRDARRRRAPLRDLAGVDAFAVR